MVIDLVRLVIALINLVLYVAGPVRVEPPQSTGRLANLISQTPPNQPGLAALFSVYVGFPERDHIRVLSRVPPSPPGSNVLCRASYHRACCSISGA